MTSHETELKRKESIKCLIDPLKKIPLSADFYLKANYTITKIGLQRKAKEERFFESDNWNDPKLREELILKIEEFLERQVK